MSTHLFDTLLVANRGEIALRVMRTARRLGLRTVAVYSTADRDSPHVAYADRACLLGEAPARESYLAIDRIIAAALSSGAQAIHPGYGFLSENAQFAEAVEAAGLIFVGPTAESIKLMGNKAAAKVHMLAAGVPCIPGYQGSVQDDAVFIKAAEEIGFPLMIKAAAGGGGRGMRLVHDVLQLPAAIISARSESKASFASDELIMERAISEARHIEVQVFADSHGNVVHLGERDCSVQRRHQKLIEESPSPAVSPALRERLGAAAVQAARSIGYRGAGTIEFLLDAAGEFYFMEMNTRLQVEHGVTELVTGLDLVEWQLRVAAGEALPLSQQDVNLSGHAIEVRLCLEDTEKEFLPQTGEVLLWEPEAGVRIDSALQNGVIISPYYDSMAAKLMAHSATRAESIKLLAEACERSVLLGIRHNLGFLRDCLRHPVFFSGDANTSFIGRYLSSEQRQRGELPQAVLVAAAILYSRSAIGDVWTNAQGLYRLVELALEGGADPRLLRVAMTRNGEIEVVPNSLDSAAMLALHAVQSKDTLCFDLGSMRHSVRYVFAANGGLWLHFRGDQFLLYDVLHTHTETAQDAAHGGGILRASLAGRLVDVPVCVGETVKKGQPLVVLESMKMEVTIASPFDGTIVEVNCVKGDQVMPGKVLIHIESAEAQGGKEQGAKE